jgi:ubiquinone/menaquinone biosynthesis C-methylase UbiE
MRNIDLEAERQYENLKLTSVIPPRKSQERFYWATQLPIENFERQMFAESFGKEVLEIGCSSGQLTFKLAQSAKNITGIDISDEGVQMANEIAESESAKNCRFIAADAHSLPFENDSLDVVVAISILHHLDFETAIKEISRVLKPTGKLLSREPLGTNPVFQLYRSLTPTARTHDEWPLSFSHLQILKTYFDLDQAQYFGFLSIVSAFLMHLPGANICRLMLTKLDKILSRTPLKYFFWQISINAVPKK